MLEKRPNKEKKKKSTRPAKRPPHPIVHTIARSYKSLTAIPAGHGIRNFRTFMEGKEEIFEMVVTGSATVNTATTFQITTSNLATIFPLLGQLWASAGTGIFLSARFMALSAQASPFVGTGSRTLSGVYALSTADQASNPSGVDLLNNIDSMIYAAPLVSATPFDISSVPYCSKKSMMITAAKSADEALWYPEVSSGVTLNDLFVLGMTCVTTVTATSQMIFNLKAQFKGINFDQ